MIEGFYLLQKHSNHCKKKTEYIWTISLLLHEILAFFEEIFLASCMVMNLKREK